MKKLLLSLSIMLSIISKINAQEKPLFAGHKLQRTTNTDVYTYQSSGGVPKLTQHRLWNWKYTFYSVKEVTVGGVVYVQLFIPSANKSVVETTAEKLWATGSSGFISSSDFNTLLFIKKADYSTFSTDAFQKYSKRWVFSGITTPVKIQKATQGRAASLTNASVNLGSFLGYRIGYYDQGGVSFGGFLGISSINQEVSNNTAITGTSSEAMTALNYGVGLVFDVTNQVQLGAIMGWDRGYGDKSTTYIYQKQNWVSLSLSFNFLDFGAKRVSQ